MRESLGLFESILKLGIFRRKSIYILLNKVDIFQRTISEIPISNYFPEYTGGANCYNACKFFADKFFSIGIGSHPAIFPLSAVDRMSVLNVSSCIRHYEEFSSKLYLDSRYNQPAWSWAKMNLNLSRERRSYMANFRGAHIYLYTPT